MRYYEVSAVRAALLEYCSQIWSHDENSKNLTSNRHYAIKYFYILQRPLFVDNSFGQMIQLNNQQAAYTFRYKQNKATNVNCCQ